MVSKVITIYGQPYDFSRSTIWSKVNHGLNLTPSTMVALGIEMVQHNIFFILVYNKTHFQTASHKGISRTVSYYLEAMPFVGYFCHTTTGHLGHFTVARWQKQGDDIKLANHKVLIVRLFIKTVVKCVFKSHSAHLVRLGRKQAVYCTLRLSLFYEVD